MKLGVAGLLPPDWRQIDVQAARRVRQAGFRGAQWFFPQPLAADLADVRRVQAAFQAAELEIAQVNGWYECLVNPDEARRAEGVRGLQALCRLGRLVEAPSVYVRPGSLNLNGHWWPHPGNHTPETFARLVDSLRQVCRVAEFGKPNSRAEAVTLAIEGHVLSPLDSPQRVKDLLAAVASPALKFNVDPVNFVGTVGDVHHTGRVINALFDLLGPDTVVGHAKDCALGEALVVHIEEVVIGTGMLDYALFLRRFQQCCPDGYLLIEHLPDAQVPAARQALVKVAEQQGIPLVV